MPMPKAVEYKDYANDVLTVEKEGEDKLRFIFSNGHVNQGSVLLTNNALAHLLEQVKEQHKNTKVVETRVRYL